MVHLSNYQFKSNIDAIDRLSFRTVDLHTPLNLGGYFALFSPGTAPKKCAYYSFYWFAKNSGELIKKAVYISPNNH